MVAPAHLKRHTDRDLDALVERTRFAADTGGTG